MNTQDVPIIQAIRDKQAHQLDISDDIVRTAKENGQGLTRDEKAAVDRATATHDIYADLLASLGGGVTRSFNAPNVNVRGAYSAGNEATRSLDAFLWATPESVLTGNGARNPVEQVIVRSDMSDGGVIAPRLSVYGPAHAEAVRSFQATVAEMVTFGLMVDKDAKSSRQGFDVARSHRLMAPRWHEVCRALDIDTSGEGGAWVPTGIGASVHEKVRAAGKVAPLFERINMPSNPWKWPIEGSDAAAYRVSEPIADNETPMTASTPGTVAATFDAEIFGARTVFSRFIEADAAVEMAKFVVNKLVKAFVNAEESAILDGDTDGTHMDTDVHALGATDARWAWDGLRKRGLAETSTAITTTTAANLALLRKSMGKWGVDPGELAFIVGVSSLHALLADTALLTVDKMGPQAVILNGQIGSIYGVPVIVSEHVREDLNASGVDDAITATKTWAACVHRGEFAMGSRMALDIEIDDSIFRQTAQRVAVAFARQDFQAISSASTDDICAAGYNITSGS